MEHGPKILRFGAAAQPILIAATKPWPNAGSAVVNSGMQPLDHGGICYALYVAQRAKRGRTNYGPGGKKIRPFKKTKLGEVGASKRR